MGLFVSIIFVLEVINIIRPMYSFHWAPFNNNIAALNQTIKILAEAGQRGCGDIRLILIRLNIIQVYNES